MRAAAQRSALMPLKKRRFRTILPRPRLTKLMKANTFLTSQLVLRIGLCRGAYKQKDHFKVRFTLGSVGVAANCGSSFVSAALANSRIPRHPKLNSELTTNGCHTSGRRMRFVTLCLMGIRTAAYKGPSAAPDAMHCTFHQESISSHT
jgi:hypothetical protein